MNKNNNMNENECFSESGVPSEMDDMNKLLEQMDQKSFKGFKDSDCNSVEDPINDCKSLIFRF